MADSKDVYAAGLEIERDELEVENKYLKGLVVSLQRENDDLYRKAYFTARLPKWLPWPR